MDRHITVYDTTFRDGSQGSGVEFSTASKLALTQRLADLNFQYVEGGWVGSRERDDEYFGRLKGLNLGGTKVATFSMTRKAGTRVEEDENIKGHLRTDVPVATVVG